MRHPKKVWIDFTYYDPSNKHNPIAAFFKKGDSDFKCFILEDKSKVKELEEKILNLELQIDCLNRWKDRK